MVREEPGAAHRRAGIEKYANGQYQYRPRGGNRGFIIGRTFRFDGGKTWEIKVCELAPNGMLMNVSGVKRVVTMQAPLDDVINAALLMV